MIYFFQNLDVPVSSVNHTMLAKLKSAFAVAVGVPKTHVHIYKIQVSTIMIQQKSSLFNIMFIYSRELIA